jgi:hypothetical protein
MNLNDLKFGDKIYGKFSGVNYVVVSTSSDFMGRGETVFMVSEVEPSVTRAFAFDTFSDYYEKIVEVKTLCQRHFAGHDRNGNPRAIWLEFDAMHGDVMSVTVETNGTPKRLYSVPQLPDMGTTAKDNREWISMAKNSETILFFE